MHSLANFQPYLVGNRSKVKTDHNSLRYFPDQKGLNERKQKWVSNTHTYDFEIEYFKGKNNAVADALSRRLATFSLIDIVEDWKSNILVEYSKN